MSYFSKKFSIATAPTGERDGAGLMKFAQRTWIGHVREETVRKWLAAKGLKKASVSFHGVHKARGITVRPSVDVEA